MGVDIELMHVQQTGTSPKGRRLLPIRAVGDPHSVFARLLERLTRRGLTPTLDRIDAYGTIELGHDEMPLLADELSTVRGQTIDPAEIALLDEVTVLVRECASSQGTVLVFEGD